VFRDTSCSREGPPRNTPTIVPRILESISGAHALPACPPMAGKGESVRLTVSKYRVRIANTRTHAPDNFPGTMLFVLHDRYDWDADARFHKHALRRLLMRRSTINDDCTWIWPLRIREATRKNLFQRCNVIVLILPSVCTDTEGTILLLLGNTAVNNSH